MTDYEVIIHEGSKASLEDLTGEKFETVFDQAFPNQKIPLKVDTPKWDEACINFEDVEYALKGIADLSGPRRYDALVHVTYHPDFSLLAGALIDPSKAYNPVHLHGSGIAVRRIKP